MGALLLFLFITTAANAGLVTYKDENGTLHAVMSLDDVPEKYKAATKQTGTSAPTQAAPPQPNMPATSATRARLVLACKGSLTKSMNPAPSETKKDAMCGCLMESMVNAKPADEALKSDEQWDEFAHIIETGKASGPRYQRLVSKAEFLLSGLKDSAVQSCIDKKLGK